MSELDDLIAQCKATPDDDTPRLAWANAVGGERGELVVVQCRLASSTVTNRDEWRRLRARERELVAANGVAWSGIPDEKPCSYVYRRGFLEALELVCSYDTRLDTLLAAAPLAHSIANHLVVSDDDDFARLVANARSTGFAALRISGDRLIQLLVDRGIALRALSISNCSRAGARLLAASGLLANVERLGLRSVEDGARIVSAAPRLRALSIDGALADYAAAIPRTVVNLVCHVPAGIDAVAALAIAPTLERLYVDAPEFTWDFGALSTFRALRTLDLFGAKPGPRNYRPFALERANADRGLPALRELSLGMWFDAQSVESVARALGPQLDTLHWSGTTPSGPASLAELHAPLVAGDAGVAMHVDGELVVGFKRPWARRPLEFGHGGGGPWFEGGVVSAR